MGLGRVPLHGEGARLTHDGFDCVTATFTIINEMAQSPDNQFQRVIDNAIFTVEVMLK